MGRPDDGAFHEESAGAPRPPRVVPQGDPNSAHHISMKIVFVCLFVGLAMAILMSSFSQLGGGTPTVQTTISTNPQRAAETPRGSTSSLFRHGSSISAAQTGKGEATGPKDAFLYVNFVLSGGDGYDGAPNQEFWGYYADLHKVDASSNLANTPNTGKYHRRHGAEVGWTARSPLVPHSLCVSLNKSPDSSEVLSAYFNGIVNAIERIQVTDPFFWTIMSSLRLRDSVRAESILLTASTDVTGFRLYDDALEPQRSNNSGAGWFPRGSSPFARVQPSNRGDGSKGLILSTNMHPTVIAGVLYKLVYGLQVHDRFHDFPGRNTAEDLEPLGKVGPNTTSSSRSPNKNGHPHLPPMPLFFDDSHSQEHLFPFTDIVYFCDLPAVVQGAPSPTCKETLESSFLDSNVLSSLAKFPFRERAAKEGANPELFGIRIGGGGESMRGELGLLHARLRKLMKHVSITVVERGPLTKKPNLEAKKKVYSLFPLPDANPTRPLLVKSDVLRHVPRDKYRRIVYLDYDTFPQMPIVGTTEVLNSQKAVSFFRPPPLGYSYEKERRHKSPAAKKAAQEKELQKSRKKKLAKQQSGAVPPQKEGEAAVSTKRRLFAMEDSSKTDLAAFPKPSASDAPAASSTLILNRPLFQRPLQTKMDSAGRFLAPRHRGDGGDNVTITRLHVKWSDLFNLVSSETCVPKGGGRAAPVGADIAFSPEVRHQHNLAPHLYNSILFPTIPPSPPPQVVPNGITKAPPITLDTVIESAPPGTFASIYSRVGIHLDLMGSAYFNDSFGIASYFDPTKLQGFSYESQFNTGLMVYRNDFGAGDSADGAVVCANTDTFMRHWSWTHRSISICNSDRVLWDQCSLPHTIRSLSRQVRPSMVGERTPTTLNRIESVGDAAAGTSGAVGAADKVKGSTEEESTILSRKSFSAAETGGSVFNVLQSDAPDSIPERFRQNTIRVGQISEMYNYRDALGTPNHLTIGGISYNRHVVGKDVSTAFEDAIVPHLAKLNSNKEINDFCSSSGLTFASNGDTPRTSLISNALLDLRNKEVAEWEDEEERLLAGSLNHRYITVLTRQPWLRNGHADVPLFYHMFNRVIVALQFGSETHTSRPIANMPNTNIPGNLPLTIDPVKTDGVSGSKFRLSDLPSGLNIKNTAYSSFLHDPTFRSPGASVFALARLRRLRAACRESSKGSTSSPSLWREALGTQREEESVVYRYRSIPDHPFIKLQRLPRFVISFIESTIYPGRFLMDHRSRSIKHRLPLSVALRLGFEVSVAEPKPSNGPALNDLQEEMYRFDWARVGSILYCPPSAAPPAANQQEVDARKRADPSFRPHSRPAFKSWQEEAAYDCGAYVTGHAIGVMYVFGED